MGDLRFERHYQRVRDARDPLGELKALDDEALISALAASSREGDPYLSNILATELLNRNRQTTAIARAMGEGVIAVDRGGRITLMNPAAERMLGWRSEEVLGEGLELFLSATRGRSLTDAVRTGAPHESEAWLMRSDSQTFPADVTVSPIVHMDVPVGAVVAFRDKTERNRAEVERAALLARERAERTRAEEAHRRAELMAEAAMVLVSPLTEQARLDALAHLAAPRLADWCVVRLLEGDELRVASLAHVDPALAEAASTGESGRSVALSHGSRLGDVIRTGEPLLLSHVDDATLHTLDEEYARRLHAFGICSLLAVPLEARGRRLGLFILATNAGRRLGREDVLVAQDLARYAGLAIENARLLENERTLHEATRSAVNALNASLREMREAKSRYETFLRATATLMWQTDAEGHLVDDDGSWSAFTGVQLDPIDGWLEPIHPDDRARVNDEWRLAVEAKAPAQLEFRLRRADGEYRDMLAMTAPVSGLDGTPRGWMGATLDVTERREAETRSRDMQRELEARVRERTAELERTNAELEAFTYSVSHDLRAPLRGADYFAQLLEDEHAQYLDEDGRDIVRRLRQETSRMSALIRDLLALSRVTRTDLKRDPVDVTLAARTIVDALRNAHPDRAVEVHVAADMTAQADGELLRIALENLIGNAWKFTSHTTEARIEVGHSGEAFFVRDNGAGFDMAQSARLFRPFHRLHTAKEFEGTGVGLATVARIIRRHGGRIWAEGEPGRGATFWFTLAPEEGPK